MASETAAAYIGYLVLQYMYLMAIIAYTQKVLDMEDVFGNYAIVQ